MTTDQNAAPDLADLESRWVYSGPPVERTYTERELGMAWMLGFLEGRAASEGRDDVVKWLQEITAELGFPEPPESENPPEMQTEETE